jgi:hypothetical protein
LILYWNARDSFEHDLTAKAVHLNSTISREIRNDLDQAFSAYSLGMDMASFANLETDKKNRIRLWAEAMTQYAKSQLFSQMVKTKLLQARADNS